MLQLFTPSITDQSIHYLGKIFGDMNGIILPGNKTNILSEMFLKFNSILLVIGALIIFYMTVVGVLMTAHEGEFMKKWNSLWTPLRAVAGIAALVPTSSGYSGIQMIMMWIIVQGIGAGDQIWTTALSFIQNNGSIEAQVTNVGVKGNLSNLFQSVVCDVTAKSDYNPATPFVAPLILTQGGGYYCNALNVKKQMSFCSSGPLTLNPDAAINKLKLGPDGACGTLQYCKESDACKDSNSVSCLSCQKQKDSLRSIIAVYLPIAKEFVRRDYEYQQYALSTLFPFMMPSNVPDFISTYCTKKNVSCIFPNLPSFKVINSGASKYEVIDVLWPAIRLYPEGDEKNDFLKTVAEEYNKSLQDTVKANTQGQPDSKLTAKLEGNINKTLEDVKNDGWLFAGGYYYAIAQMNNEAAKGATPEFVITEVNFTKKDGLLYKKKTNYGAAAYLLKAASGAAGEASGGVESAAEESGFDTGKMSSAASEGFESASQSVQGVMGGSFDQEGFDDFYSANRNPLAKMQRIGTVLLEIGTLLAVTFTTLLIIMSVVLNFNLAVLGTWVDPGLGKALNILSLAIVPIVFAILGIMMTYGGLLSVYTPLVPYIIFTFGAVGWFMATIEAMVAAPLVALAILSPGGQHEVLGKAEPALMLIFSIFLRPTLMIFGLISANLVAQASVAMINAMFTTMMMSIGVGPMGLFLMLFAYTAIVLSAINKSFSLIHVVPDRVLTWIGGQGVPSEKGDEALQKAEGAVKDQASAAASGMGKMGGDAASSAGKPGHKDEKGNTSGLKAGDVKRKPKKPPTGGTAT